MPRPLGQIRILMSSRVLFNLEEADSIFKEKGERAYVDYMRGRGEYAKDFDRNLGGRVLEKGPLWNFAQAAMALNTDPANLVIEIGIICKDTPETALPIFRNMDVFCEHKMEMRFVLAGKKIDEKMHQSFGTDLLLTRNSDDVQAAVDLDIAAATVNFSPDGKPYERNPGRALKIWVDGDAVAFGSSAEVVYREKGLDGYRKHESEFFDTPVEAGPFTALLAKMTGINKNFASDDKPFELSLLTARGNDAAARVVATAEKHGIEFNGYTFTMSGASKAPPLQAHRPDFFFDDQMAHLKDGMAFCPTGLVAYKTDGPMHNHTKNFNASAKPEDTKNTAGTHNNPGGPLSDPKA